MTPLGVRVLRRLGGTATGVGVHAPALTDPPTASAGSADRVRAALEATPRCDFAVVARGGEPDDGAVETMLRLLQVRPGQQVLDVDPGSGWTTALLAHLVGPDGLVHSVTPDSGLARRAAADVAALGRWWVTVTAATPGVEGLPDEAPYDRVLVAADTGRTPHELVDQLADDGVLVAPLAGVLTRWRRHGRGVLRSGHGRFGADARR